MPRMMVHPHTPQTRAALKPTSPMVYRLRRQTPNAGYAEVEVVSHPNSHHKPGDVVLIDWGDYEGGRLVHPPGFTPPKETVGDKVADFIAINPHVRNMADSIPPKPPRQRHADTRRPRKSKDRQAPEKLS